MQVAAVAHGGMSLVNDMNKRERERAALRYAHHLALRAVKHGDGFTLRERYGSQKKIGSYRSVETLERGIRRQHDRMLAEIEREIEEVQ